MGASSGHQNKFIETWQRQTPRVFNWFTNIFRVKNTLTL